MCACRQRKSFLIEDILSDTIKKRPYKNLSNEPSKSLHCRKKTNVQKETEDKIEKPKITLDIQRETPAKFNVVTDAHEKELSKVNLDTSRNTYPLYPTAVKPNYPWNFRKEPMTYLEPNQFNYYSDPMLNTSLIRSQLAANRFPSHSLPIRQAYGFDRVSASCCSGWWLGGRRKGGQVRFTAAQTGALERRFGASKYLSPDERRALASTLRLSDRQVKTWFQNRRAKWRRAAPDSADAESPASDDGSEDDVHITD